LRFSRRAAFGFCFSRLAGRETTEAAVAGSFLSGDSVLFEIGPTGVKFVPIAQANHAWRFG
jgi:hypothetical protein